MTSATPSPDEAGPCCDEHALIATDAEFGAAWREAEALLPHRGDRRLSWGLRLMANGKGTYHAEYVPPFMPYEQWMQAHHEAFGDTATEALANLAAALRGDNP
jgi:hypothetical protein